MQAQALHFQKPALLVLADGTLFRGYSIGCDGVVSGEVVFNTSMTGYQEILTDPSYCRQLITLTCPHIGNVGCNRHDEESHNVFASGLVIREYPAMASNWRSEMSLHDFLLAHQVVAIAGIDTRRLTRILREKGAQSGCIVAGAAADQDTALAVARDFPGLAGMDLAKEVSAREPYQWSQGSWRLAGNGFASPQPDQPSYHIVAYDYGIKRNILRLLADRGCHITVVPAQYPAHKALEFEPDGIFLSNGPGDPEPCVYAIAAIRELLQTGLPVFGICLGHQLLALACGARTLKMKFGHHGGNHPVQDLATGQVLITSQNHGFTVEESSLPDTLRITHRSLFDGTLQGIECADKPAFGFQGHPEASPGPHDISLLFDRFVRLLAARSTA